MHPTRFTRAVRAVLALGALLLLAACASGPIQGPQAGHAVVFFPSYAADDGNGQWVLRVHGRVFDAANPNREWAVQALAMGVKADPKNPLFLERARHLVSDSHRNVQVAVVVGGRTVALPPSDPAGYFSGELTLPRVELGALASGGRVAYQSVATPANPQRFRGEVTLVAAEGVTVITDMDDTIKVTNMLDHAERDANTFQREFRAVEGMPALYRQWEKASPAAGHFHVVSAGPWQLHEPLLRFTRDAGFPDFTWDMRSVDATDPGVLLSEARPDPQRTQSFKEARITEFLQRFGKRRVVLVGDSGEWDPEVYSRILAKFPDRVERVYIRNVRADDQPARYDALFPGALRSKLRVFRDPKELADS